MAKSIIQIDVDDSKFLQFKSIFDDYKQSLESTPEAWSDANSEMGNMVQASQLLKNDAEKRLALLQSATLEESKAEKAAQKSEDARKKSTEDRKKKDLESIKRWKELGSTIAGATAQLAKFAAVGLGIATGATTLGMGKLANDASAARFQSMGLGMSSGAMQAANINYSSALGNPSANLAAVRDAQQDLSKQRLFSTAGIGNYQNKSTEQLLPELMVAAQKMAKQTPQGQLAQVSQAYGYTDVFSMEDLTRFKQMSETEMKAMIAKAAQDNKALDVNNSTLKSYQDLQKQWDRFGQSMENTWIKGLEPLAPALTRFSEAIGSAFEKFMAADKLEPIINKLADGITRFSAYLTSPEAEQDFDKLIKNIKDVAATLGTFAAWVGSITPEKAMAGAAVVGGGALAVGAAATGVGALAAGAASTALPLAAAGAGGAYVGNKIYQNDTPENQEWTQKLVGNVAAFFGDKTAQDAQAQLKSFETNNKIAEEALKNGTTNTELAKEANARLKELGKPMSKDDYKKIEDESRSGFINGIYEKFKDALRGQFGESSGCGSGGGGGGIADSTANMKGSAKATYAMTKLMQMGWTKEQAAGVAANLHRESGFKTDIVGDGGKAYGIGQWHPDRQANFAKKFGHSIKGSTLDEQLQFVDYELKSTEKGAGDKLKNARTAREAGGIVSKFYERPRDRESEAAGRGGHAEQLSRQYNPELTPFIAQKGEKDINGKVKDTYALRKPTADQQQSVMFQDQGGQYGTNSSRVQINVNNSTGGSATASAVSL